MATLPPALYALVEATPLAERLRASRERLDAGERADLLRYAALASLDHDAEEAATALKWARQDRAAPAEALAAGTAFMAWRLGDPARGLAAAERAGGHPFAAALGAICLAELGRGEQAAERLPDAGSLGGAVASFVHVARALIALEPPAAGELPGSVRAAEAHQALEGLRESGVLGAMIERLRADAFLHLAVPDAKRARAHLSQAVWKLLQIGVSTELGRCYLAMARVEAADDDAEGGPRDRAAEWLARAHPIVRRSGTSADRERLRTWFRRFGRRAVDRLVEGDLETRIEGVRRHLAHVRDLRAAIVDGRQAGEDVRDLQAQLTGALHAVESSQEELIATLEGVLVDKERSGRLVHVSRQVFLVDTIPELDEALPRLALELDGGDGAVLLRVLAGSTPPPRRRDDRASVPPPSFRPPLQDPSRTVQLAVVQGHGARPPLDRELERVARRVLDAGAPALHEHDGLVLAVAPIRTSARDLLLVVARPVRRSPLGGQELERLALLGSVAVAAYERAHGAEALREAADRDAATLETIRDGILTLGPDHDVRSLNRAAAGLLGVAREELVGTLLDAEPAFRALVDAIDREAEDEPVSLPRHEVLVRARRYPGGTVAMLRELESAQQLAHKLVGSAARFTFDDLVGEDPAFRRTLADARRAASTDVPILITGESGTGKELVAQAIHNASPRSAQPFVGMNVAAIPRELLESELFGYERGAFTGARSGGMAGKFELAGRGTILLDEIGDMPFDMQAKMLRVLQERLVQRLGGTRDLPIRARVLATTHQNLEEAVEKGAFRLDLFYRLRVVHLRLPPLRERRGDIAPLVEHHLRLYAERTRRPPIRVAPPVMRAFERYGWPGNIRELANLIEGLASLLPRGVDVIDEVPTLLERGGGPPSDVAPTAAVAVAAVPSGPPAPEQVRSLEEVERDVFSHALQAFDGNVARAARALGVARGTFYNKIKRYGLR